MAEFYNQMSALTQGVTTLGGSDSHLCVVIGLGPATHAPIMTQRCEFTAVRAISSIAEINNHLSFAIWNQIQHMFQLVKTRCHHNTHP